MEELDVQRLVNELNTIKEDRNIILTMHIFIEILMNNFLDKYFENPKELPIFFMQKYKLLNALGLPKSNNLNKNILRINEIRKKFAHNLDARLDINDFRDLKSDMPGKSAFEQTNISIEKFKLLCVGVLLELEYELEDFLKKVKK